MKYIKYIFFFAIYVALHYVEGLPDIGGFSVAQLWKLPIILSLICYVVFTWKRINKFEMASFLLVFESLLCIETLNNPISTIVSAIKLLPCVLFFHYFANSGKSLKTLKKITLFFSRSICLTSLITLLGICNPIKENPDASSFGVEGVSYYSSLFGAPHAATSYFAIAIVTLLFFLIKNKRTSRFWMLFDIAMVIIAFLSNFKAYIRTGWLMLCVGIVFLFGLKNIIKKPRLLMLLLVSILVIFVLFQNNEMFHARMTGVNIYHGTGGDAIELTGSGRITFWKNGFELWINSSPYELLFGQGFTKVAENNSKTTGMKVFSHNLFIDTLAQHGIIGLIFLLLIYIFQYKYIEKRKRSPYYRLCVSIFMMTIIFSFFQSEMYFDFAIIYATCLALLTQSMNQRQQVSYIYKGKALCLQCSKCQ